MSLPIHLTYNAGHGDVAGDYALLVVACDPRALCDVIKDHTGHEKEVNRRLTSFTMRTVLFRAQRKEGSKYAVRLNPTALNEDDLWIYGWRDEVRARKIEVEERAEAEAAGGEGLVVTYQMKETPLLGADRAEVDAKLKKHLERDLAKDWTAFEAGERLTDHLTDYFPHFDLDGLADGLPWAVLDNQGQRATLYVSSFTCFESVLQCKQYGDMLWEQPQVQAALPADKGAPIAVIGAGPSGLLFATQELVRKGGYSNVTIFEERDTYGGKTRTFYATTSKGEVVPCEMGTCYLSTAYEDDIVSLSDEYDSGKLEPLVGPNMRSIAETEQAEDSDEERDGVEFDEWVKRENGGTNPITDTLAQGKVALALVKYKKIHRAVMGTRYCMPLKKPQRKRKLLISDDVYEDALTMKYEPFLIKYGLEALVPLFLYTYEVQGYGRIEEIPAYYGLVWITAELAEGILLSQTVGNGEIVFVYDKGFLRLWEKIVEHHRKDLKFVFNAKVLSITRD